MTTERKRDLSEYLQADILSKEEEQARDKIEEIVHGCVIAYNNGGSWFHTWFSENPIIYKLREIFQTTSFTSDEGEHCKLTFPAAIQRITAWIVKYDNRTNLPKRVQYAHDRLKASFAPYFKMKTAIAQLALPLQLENVNNLMLHRVANGEAFQLWLPCLAKRSLLSKAFFYSYIGNPLLQKKINDQARILAVRRPDGINKSSQLLNMHKYLWNKIIEFLPEQSAGPLVESCRGALFKRIDHQPIEKVYPAPILTACPSTVDLRDKSVHGHKLFDLKTLKTGKIKSDLKVTDGDKALLLQAKEYISNEINKFYPISSSSFLCECIIRDRNFGLLCLGIYDLQAKDKLTCLYTMLPGENLTSPFAAISPDGKYAAIHMVNENNASQKTYDIRIFNLTLYKCEQVIVLQQPLADFYWSNDSLVGIDSDMRFITRWEMLDLEQSKAAIAAPVLEYLRNKGSP